MRIEDTKKEPEIAEMIEGSEGDRRRLSELLDGIRVGPGVDAMADEMREVVWADVRLRIRRRGLRMRIARYAAAAAVMVGVICGSWFMGGLRVENRLVAEAHPVVISTPRGVKSDVILPDGSRVRLNGGTRIVYLTLFGDQRRVEVDGEAYFEVEHDRRAPFVVSTNGLDIEVLGTRFNIRNDDSDHRITTVLLEGAVKAYASGDEKAAVRLRPSQQLVFDTRTGAMRLTDEPSADRSINWIDGRFCFEHDTFGEIVAELKRYYNVDIRFMDNRLRDMRFSGNFRVEDGIYHIMSVLQLTYKFTYKVVGNDIEIYPNPKR